MKFVEPGDGNRRVSLLRVALQYIFVGAIVFSLSGSLLIRLIPAAAAFFGPYYVALVKVPTWMYMIILPIIPLFMYARQTGYGRLLLLVLCGSLIGGLSEVIGTTTGYPFGSYLYTEWLGPKFLGHVPYFIPFSWFAMSVVSYDLAGRLTRSLVGHIAIATLFMVLWDVSLDPAMSRAFPFWSYPAGSFFYGMPLSNWVGWALVSVLIMSGYTLILRGDTLRHTNAMPFYVLNCAFPLLLSLVYGLYGAFVVGLLATSVPWVTISLNSRSAATGVLFQK